MTNNQSLLERWAKVVEIVKKHGGPKMPAVLSRTREISAKGVGPWKLDGIVGTDFDDDPYTVSCPDAAIAVLEKWLREDVAVWAEEEPGIQVDVPWYVAGVWKWRVRSSRPHGLSGDSSCSTKAHLLAAEALCECLEVG